MKKVENYVVLSLFDGASSGQMALREAGCKRQVLSGKKWQLISSTFWQLTASVYIVSFQPADFSAGSFIY